VPAPRLDSRSLEQLRSQLRDLAGLYLPAPRWTGVDNLNDPAWRLLSDVFARLLELLIARLNDVPEMHFMRFLDFVGVERSPGSAAAGTFRRGPGSRRRRPSARRRSSSRRAVRSSQRPRR